MLARVDWPREAQKAQDALAAAALGAADSADAPDEEAPDDSAPAGHVEASSGELAAPGWHCVCGCVCVKRRHTCSACRSAAGHGGSQG